jgi:hypothetical protein
MSSIIRTLTPSFSKRPRFSGQVLTSQPTSLHAMAKTCLSVSQLLPRISASFFGSSDLFSVRILAAFSVQNVGDRCGGLHRKCPARTSDEYSSKVVCELVYSSKISTNAFKSSKRSVSVRWRPFNVSKSGGRCAETAAGSKVSRLDLKRFNRVDRSSRVVFSLGDSRISCV